MISSKYLLSFFFFIVTLIFTSCGFGEKKETSSSQIFSQGKVIADTIIYPVDVINLDSADRWKETRLKKLNHKELTNFIFDALYNGKATAIDYYTRKPVTIKEIKEMENSGEFSRKKISQLQFEESWFFDPEEARMTKQVHSILLAWPVFDSRGEFQAYKAGFVVELNH